MFIEDDEKDSRKAALQKLMDLMGSETGKRLSGLKAKPVAASMTIEKMPGDMEDEPGDMEGDEMGEDEPDGDEPSEDDKAKIAELYHKYCK